MYDSPSSLQSSCVNYIGSNIEAFYGVVQNHNDPVQFTLKENDVYLHTNLSEQLLSVLCTNGKLNDQTISIFDDRTTRLEKVVLQNVQDLSRKGLKTFRNHRIVDLEATDLKVPISDLIDSLSEWTLENLRSLNVNNCTFVDCSRVAVMVSLSKLRNLKTLNVSYTEFNNHGLVIIVEDLRLLESLDISETRVTEISPLGKCHNRLQVLLMHNLKISKTAISVIAGLHQLRYLDVSRNSDSRFQAVYVLFDHITSPLSLSINELLLQQKALLALEYLDISGCQGIEIDTLTNFLEFHPTLRFLGLLDCEACYESIFAEKKKSLVVTGSANEDQILESLARYPKRVRCTQISLFDLFSLTQQFTEPRVNVIQLILRAMRLHPSEYHIQIAATACLYNLTKGEIGQKIHPRILKDVVHCTLAAMENFPNNLQLQKNILLTLCSDRILQDVTFDRYRCAHLVLDCLCTFDDSSMERMSVAICSILAAKISTSETTVLGSTPKYMRKLLSLVKTIMESTVDGEVDREVNITLKFTLSALWNLTDESPETCGVFLREGGLDLFLRVLEAFPGKSTVETKILGLINNIAEVKTLRHRLMVDQFLSALHHLLRSPLIDVAYFAAGIVAHLASAGADLWVSEAVPRPIILQELVTKSTKNLKNNYFRPAGQMITSIYSM